MKTRTMNLGLAGMVIAILAALPATAALAKDRDDDRGGREAAHRNDDRDRDRDRGGDRGRDWGREGWHGGVVIGIDPRPRVVERWVPGHYETRIEHVLVDDGHYMTQTAQVLAAPGRYEDRYIPAVTRTWRDRYGRQHVEIVSPARVERVWMAPLYETRATQVWCPPRYEDRSTSVWVPGYTVADATPRRTGFSISGIFGW